MRCCYHTDVDAVAQCVDCERGLCPECADRFQPVLCGGCLQERASQFRKELVRNIFLMIVLFAVGIVFANVDPTTGPWKSVVIGYSFAGIPFGWSVLNRITPNVFLFMSWFGWFVYFVFKIVLSISVGLFVTPFKLVSMVKGYADIRKAVGLLAQAS